MHYGVDVTRRIAMVLAALLVPGGFIVLFAAVAVKALAHSNPGRKLWGRVAALWGRSVTPPPPVRQAA